MNDRDNLIIILDSDKYIRLKIMKKKVDYVEIFFLKISLILILARAS